MQKHLAMQYMLQPGSPFFAKHCVITTLETFLLNFFKLPAHELWKAFQYDTAHFEFPRAMIYTSIIVFDEFHLFSGLGSLDAEYKSLNAVTAAMRSLALAGVVIIIMTATMPDSLKQFVKKELIESGIEFREYTYEKGKDLKFDDELQKRKRLIKKSLQDPVDLARHFRNQRVAIVANTKQRAIEYYRKINDTNTVLFHGGLPQVKREQFLKKIKNEKEILVIATQVIEAGIDTNFDVMITEICPADRLVQRAGRVARSEITGEVLVVNPKTCAPYDKVATEATWNFIEDSNLDYFECRSLIKKVYDQLPPPTKISPLSRSLSLLDHMPLLGLPDAKAAFEYFEGFTESSGIISAFIENKIDPNWAIPVNEAEARDILAKTRKLVSGRVIVELQSLPRKEPLSIYFLKNGYSGIVIDRQTYLENIGLNESDTFGGA
jgi:CRISPR-associated endonuclease/helicase Cas3